MRGYLCEWWGTCVGGGECVWEEFQWVVVGVFLDGWMGGRVVGVGVTTYLRY